MKRLDGQTAVIFGASGPIGAGVAAALGREGANVVVHYFRNKAMADRVVSAVRNSGAQATAMNADITDEPSIVALIGDAAVQFGAIDSMINCAHGSFEPKRVADLTWADWSVHLDALKGHFLMCKSVLPIMRRQRHGRIVFVSGGLSHRLFSGFSAFSTIKAGLNAFSKTLALEEGTHGITVNIVAPGKVTSDISAQQHPAAWENIESHQLSRAPLGRYASIEDVVEAVLFFVLPGASGVTGQTLFVAGGEVML